MAIPKIIHYIWLGGSPMGELSRVCIESWKKFCPDYKIMRWDESNFNPLINQYCRDAYAAKKYAFVSDYIRLQVLYNYGGIYLDTDIELIKPFDELLNNKAFIGNETFYKHDEPLLVFTTAAMACAEGFPLFLELAKIYEDLQFYNDDGNLDLTQNSTRIAAYLHKKYGLKINNNLAQTVKGLKILPKDYFFSVYSDAAKKFITKNTIGLHHCRGSWN